jgi:hypothetical protein
MQLIFYIELPRVSKEEAIEYLKSIMTKTKPSNEEMYEGKFLTPNDFVELLESRFSGVNQPQLRQWISPETHFFKTIPR